MATTMSAGPGDNLLLSGLADTLADIGIPSESDVERILGVAALGKGLSTADTASLLLAPARFGKTIFDAAAALNARTKGKRITFYGVIYIHDFCVNLCRYCGDSIHAEHPGRRVLSPSEFQREFDTLLGRHPLREICVLMGESIRKFPFEKLVEYLGSVSGRYSEKLILNIPPLGVEEFRELRRTLPNNRLHFRVFQETYDRDIYMREHTHGPKKDFDWRLAAQDRALEAGFDEVGHGVLYGLNDKNWGAEFDTLAMLTHAANLFARHGKRSQSMSFPRLRAAPGLVPRESELSDERLVRCIAASKLTMPTIDTVLTCRESATFRRATRPIVNIEDFAARPGPGGNSDERTHQQMILPDLRSGEAVREEIEGDGFEVS